MIVTTLNSIYAIRAEGQFFRITKVSPENVEPRYLKAGEVRFSSFILVEVGRSAEFDGWHTAEVVSVQEDEPDA